MIIESFKRDNGWITTIKYRKSMDDYIIEQYRKTNKKQTYRFIFLTQAEAEMIKRVFKLRNELVEEKE